MISARVRSNRLRKVNQTKRLRFSGSGKDSPQIHRQLPRDRHHRLLPCGGVWRRAAKHMRPFLERSVLRLPAHHPPYHLHKHCSHSWIPAFAHTSRPALAPAAVLMPSLRSLGHPSGFAALRPSRQKPLARFAWTQSRVTRHLPPVVEPTPIPDLSPQNLNPQRSYATRSLPFPRRLLQLVPTLALL